MTDIDALLRRYDAESGTGLTPADAQRAEQLLDQIVQYPLQPTPTRRRKSASGRRSSTRRTRPRFALGIAGAAATLLVAGGLAVSGLFGNVIGMGMQATGSGGGFTNAELAAWTSMPSHPSAVSPAVEQAATSCLSTLHIPYTASGVTVSNVDQRGTVLTLIATSAGSRERAWCLGTAGRIVLSELVDSPHMPLPRIRKNAVNLEDASMQSDHGGGNAISLVWGQAGPGVTGVTLTTTAGQTITATVQNGLWTLWWPPRNTSTGDIGGIVTWKTADGATHTASMNSLYSPR